MGKTVFITGAAGFIGSNSVRYFHSLGYSVIGFDNLSRRGVETNLGWLQENFPGFRFIEGDVRNYEAVVYEIQKSRPDAILHLAGQVAVTTSIRDPRVDFDVNAVGTLNMLEATRLHSPESKFIFSSTNKVYGDLEDLELKSTDSRFEPVSVKAIPETRGLDFYSPYGCSKGAADQYVRDYGRIYGLHTFVLRQSCVYGQRQFGVEDQGWVAWFALRGLSSQPVTVFGTGRQVRDLLNVEDLVRLYGLLADSNQRVSNVYNVGGGHSNSLSLNEFLALLRTRFGLSFRVDFESERQGDQLYFVSDNSKLGRDYGWKPEISLEEGLPALLEWLETVPEEFRK